MHTETYKLQATRLAEHLASVYGLKLKHTKSLEAIACLHGARNWHTLNAAGISGALEHPVLGKVRTQPATNPLENTVLCDISTRNKELTAILTEALAGTRGLYYMAAAGEPVKKAALANRRVFFSTPELKLSDARVTHDAIISLNSPANSGDAAAYEHALAASSSLEALEKGFENTAPGDMPIIVSEERCMFLGENYLVTVVTIPDSTQPAGVRVHSFLTHRNSSTLRVTHESFVNPYAAPEPFGIARTKAFQLVQPATIALGSPGDRAGIRWKGVSPERRGDIFTLSTNLTPPQNGRYFTAASAGHLQVLLTSLLPSEMPYEESAEISQLLMFFATGISLEGDVLLNAYKALSTDEALTRLVKSLIGDSLLDSIPELSFFVKPSQDRHATLDTRTILTTLRPVLVQLREFTLITFGTVAGLTKPMDELWDSLLFATERHTQLYIVDKKGSTAENERAKRYLALLQADLIFRRKESGISRPLALVTSVDSWASSTSERMQPLLNEGIPLFRI